MMQLKIQQTVMNASTIQVLGPPCHLECDYILVNKNCVHPCTSHHTLIPNYTTSVLCHIKYY
jgi:hypothetical protein